MTPNAPVVQGVGGAESDVAVAPARLDVPCTWIGGVGDDATGTPVTGEVRGESVTVVARRDDPDAPTGAELAAVEQADVVR